MTGGADESNHYLTSTEVFKDGSWTPGPQLPNLFYKHCQVEIGGLVIIIGGGQDGGSGKTFVLEENVWSEVGSLTQARQYHACVEFAGKLYTIGGKTGTLQNLDSVEVFDPATKTWAEGPKLPAKVAWAQAINFENTLYLLGGDTDDGSPNTKIFKLADSGSVWETIDEGVNEPVRSVFPAQVVTKELLNCQ